MPSLLTAPPVFVLGCHKSGTSLVRSLLDGHPELFVIPSESHPFPLLRYWVKYPFQRTGPQAADLKRATKLATRLIDQQNAHNDPYADVILRNRYDIERMRGSLEAYQPRSDSEWIAAYFRSLYVALYGEEMPEGQRVVEKSVENAEFALVLATFFPGARFVHVVRNPYATLVAIRRHKIEGKSYPVLTHAVQSIRNSYYHLVNNERVLSNYLVVRYEDVVHQPASTMLELASFLDIPFTEGLLMPTSGGRPWRGNSTTGEAFDGISTRPANAWRDDLNSLECHMLNTFSGPICDRFGYPRIEPERSPWRPVPGESLGTWIRNRIWLRLFASLALGQSEAPDSGNPSEG